MVLNHTSSNHPWFIVFVITRMISDYYVWKNDNITYVWWRLSGRFMKVAPVRCVLLSFSTSMRFNLSNPKVVDNKERYWYWLDLGC